MVHRWCIGASCNGASAACKHVPNRWPERLQQKPGKQINKKEEASLEVYKAGMG